MNAPLPALVAELAHTPAAYDRPGREGAVGARRALPARSRALERSVTIMSSILVHAVLADEISIAKSLLRNGDYEQAMHHLERAHVLGQRFIGSHVLVHWLMLRVAVARRAPKAALGQIVRLVLGAIGSAVGVLPIGNTGGSDVGMFRSMPIPADLARVLEGVGHV